MRLNLVQAVPASPAGRWCIVLSDIHALLLERQALQEDVRRQRSMLDASVDRIKLIDVDGTLHSMNRSGCLALGLAADETRFGVKWLDLLPHEVRARGRAALALSRHGRHARFPGMSHLPGARPQYWDNLLTPLMDADGTTHAVLCVSREVTRQREAEQRLREASETDALTGLLNRRAFNASLKRTVARARADGGQVGLLMIDLDHFKHVNDMQGHAAGDHLLRVLSRRMAKALPASAFVARLGGDEFAIVLPEVRGDEDVELTADAVLAQVRPPVTCAGQDINGGMSIGCALFPRDADDASALMKCADVALNDLKSRQRGGWRMYGRQMQALAERKAAQLALARRLLDADMLRPCYQPVVSLDDGRVVGLEALVRWPGPDGRRTGSAQAITEAFRDYALAIELADVMHARILADTGLDLLPVAVNAAPAEFLRDDFAERLLGRLAGNGIAPARIVVEVGESVLQARGATHVLRAMRELKAAGVRVVLDGFGIGQSSLAQLRDCPVDGLKIDRSLVFDMLSDPHSLAVIRTICTLGSQLGLALVGVGVETEEQARLLQEAGCGLAQGRLYGMAERDVDLVGIMARGVRPAS